MTTDDHTPLGGDKLKRAIQELSELVIQHPEKKRQEIIQMVELKFDLNPAECEFLSKNFSKELIDD
ncbi:MAG: hypothetical protein D6B25_06110 [Desulfobulbaceae bacterium]|nr:MAG: hypothetical protein D6B25_06110 [Desulfobulbaceae bacterium]